LVAFLIGDFWFFIDGEMDLVVIVERKSVGHFDGLQVVVFVICIQNATLL
jgi:hypothetical protein